MGYQKYPSNARTSWTCPGCKVGVCSARKSTTANDTSDTNIDLKLLDDEGTEVFDDSDVNITNVTVSGKTDKTSSLEKLTEKEFALVDCDDGWLDCVVIHEVQLCLKNINSNIEGFQRPTLGPVRNFDVITGELIQILHTGGNHWVCISSIGCPRGHVNLYDSLFHEMVKDEVEEQVISLLADDFVKLNVVPVHQRQNGSDCGVFTSAYATCLVYMSDPAAVQFVIPKMRPHLSKCLKAGKMEPFPLVI